jgi:hypothetical protein
LIFDRLGRFRSDQRYTQSSPAVCARSAIPFAVHFPRAIEFFKPAQARPASVPSFDLALLIQ